MRLAVLLLVLSTPLGDASFPVRIQTVKGDKVAVRPYTSPLLIMQVKSGKLTEKSVVSCKQETASTEYADHGDTEIQFKCGDSVLSLKAVYFGE